MDTKIISTTFNKGQLSTPAASAVQAAEAKAAKQHLNIKSAAPEQRSTHSAEEKVINQPLDQIVDKLNSQALASNHTLRFSVDETHGKPIISVVDKETDEVIRQIPPETALKIAEAFAAVTSGNLLSESA